MQGKKSFVLFVDIWDTVKELPMDKRGELFSAILQYVSGQAPEINDLLIRVTFGPIKANIDRASEKWEKKAEQSRENGLKGGRPKNPEEPKETQRVISEPKEPVNVTANEIEKGKVSVLNATHPSTFPISEEIEDSERVKDATTHIAKFFGIGEINQSGSFIKIANFCRYQESKGRIQLLADQFTAYKKIKTKDPQFIHNWKTWIGTPEKSYEDGKWNEQDWKTKLKTDEPATTTTTDYAALRKKTLERTNQI